MTEIRRVFISHTSEFTKHPEKKSFIDAAIAAVIRAKCQPCDMEYFTARDERSAQYCIERVRACDVYIGVIGLRYGSPVHDRTDVSYTELEFDAASEEPTKTRLVFLLEPDAEVPVRRFTDATNSERQEKFRQRVSNARLTCKSFSNVDELEKLVYQALMEDVVGAGEASLSPECIDWPEWKSPYPGLRCHNEKYAPLFFGRDRETDELIERMGKPCGRVLIVSGGSGSGKSSLVEAGLWQAVTKERRLTGSEHWIWQRIKPSDGENPFQSLAWGLKQAVPDISKSVPDLAKALTENQTTIGKIFAQHLAPEQELVLYIDQLEELFEESVKKEDSKSFLEQLTSTACGSQSQLRVVATVSSEFIGRLEEVEPICRLLNKGSNYHLGPVSQKALLDIIEKPAQLAGYDFEDQLIDDIMRDAAQEPGNLPLVSYALKQLFEGRRGRIFTRDAYMAIGGVAGAIGAKADDVMENLDKEVAASFDKIFAKLVRIDRERPPARVRVLQTVFNADNESQQLIEALSGKDCRILVTDETTVEVAHEKLFTAWPKLKKWIDANAEALCLIKHAEEEALNWRIKGSNLEELWSCTRANEVHATLKKFNKEASSDLKNFLMPHNLLIKELNQDRLSLTNRKLICQQILDFSDHRPGVGLEKEGLPDILWRIIPGGQVKLKRVDHTFEVKPFKMAVFLITNAQYKAFLDAEDGYRHEEWWKGIKKSDAGGKPVWEEANAPRETVSWFDAVAFCRWLSHRRSLKIRLPTEWEWQQAATEGNPKSHYPWLNDKWDARRGNNRQSELDRTSAVGIYPDGATPSGLLDMAGNVWEWCLNTFERPESPESCKVDNASVRRAGRGGAWDNHPDALRVWNRWKDYPFARHNTLGFRLAQDIEE